MNTNLLSMALSAAIVFTGADFGRSLTPSQPAAPRPSTTVLATTSMSAAAVSAIASPSTAAVSATASPSAALTSAMSSPSAATGFAVVELFTSEGCSSCPPADEALAAITREYRENVYALSFHVDYWDRLGWKDVFSSADNTNRQRAYAEQFHLNSIYTPEAVVNGKKEFVGSNESSLRSAIAEGLAASPAGPITLSAKCEDGKHIQLTYNVDNPGKTTLQIALVQSQATSQVLRGENQGHSLHHVNVVRAFQSVSLKSGSGGGVASLKLPDGLTTKDCKIIAFLQDKGDGRVLRAAQLATL